MAKITPKWRVSDAPTGRYCSFEKRGFPSAEYANGDTCASIRCVDSYQPAKHKDATDLDLEVWLAVYRQGGWDWRRMKVRATSIAEAKKMVSDYLNGSNRNTVVPAFYRN